MGKRAGKNKHKNPKRKSGTTRPREAEPAQHVSAGSTSVPPIIFPALLILLGALAYANALDIPFVYDDLEAIVQNEHIRQLWPLSQALTAPDESPTSGRPVVSLSFALNYAFGGLVPRGYHLVNIALHIMSTLTLYGLLRRTLTSSRIREDFGAAASGLAFASALLWMVHPLLTESVNYSVQRTSLLMGFFYLLTLYCARRSMDDARPGAWTLASVLCCVLGMASKEVMVSAPLMVLLYDRIYYSHSFVQALKARRSLYVGLAASWVVFLGLFVTGPRSEGVGFSLGLSSWDYALNQCWVLTDYLRLSVWSRGLNIDYGHALDLSLVDVFSQALLIVVLLTLTGFALFRWPTLGFLGVWFFLILAPTSSFIPIPTEVGGERRVYLSLAGLVILAVMLGYALLRRSCAQGLASGKVAYPSWIRSGGLVVLGVALALAIGATRERNRDYRSSVALWETGVAAMPENPRAHTLLGMALQAEGKTDRAIAHFRQALERDPEFASARRNLGALLALRGDVEEGIAELEIALRTEPERAEGHYNLGIALVAKGEHQTALNAFSEALRLKPRHAEARANQGSVLVYLGRSEEGILALREALRIDPTLRAPRENLVRALEAGGDFGGAAQELRELARVTGEDARYHSRMGKLLARAGRSDEAVAHLTKVAALQPRNARAAFNAALVLRAAGRRDEALRYARVAEGLDPSLEGARHLLMELRVELETGQGGGDLP